MIYTCLIRLLTAMRSVADWSAAVADVDVVTGQRRGFVGELLRVPDRRPVKVPAGIRPAS